MEDGNAETGSIDASPNIVPVRARPHQSDTGNQAIRNGQDVQVVSCNPREKGELEVTRGSDGDMIAFERARGWRRYPKGSDHAPPAAWLIRIGS